MPTGAHGFSLRSFSPPQGDEDHAPAAAVALPSKAKNKTRRLKKASAAPNPFNDFHEDGAAAAGGDGGGDGDSYNPFSDFFDGVSHINRI